MQIDRPQLVIFDCDGVLVDSELISNGVLSGNLAQYGLNLSTLECMRHFMGGRMVDVAAKANEMGASLPQDWVSEIYGEIHTRLEQGVPAVEGIHDVIEHLDAAGVDHCVASNGSEMKMSITLGHAGLWERFSKVAFSAHTHGVAKPDPGLFQIAADSFGVPHANCVVVEDSVPGTIAARRAGMHCFGYAAHDDGSELAAEGAIVFSDMKELAGLINLKRGTH
ncbi:HAD family hydrolase [Hoeflea sp. TYP-13]|uniref:HAD family hydrolase n=1 Tax=Hoeflea sp. TYP-13 TaxID=3230023 RepID=UPI0034C66561